MNWFLRLRTNITGATGGGWLSKMMGLFIEVLQYRLLNNNWDSVLGFPTNLLDFSFHLARGLESKWVMAWADGFDWLVNSVPCHARPREVPHPFNFVRQGFQPTS